MQPINVHRSVQLTTRGATGRYVGLSSGGATVMPPDLPLGILGWSDLVLGATKGLTDGDKQRLSDAARQKVGQLRGQN